MAPIIIFILLAVLSQYSKAKTLTVYNSKEKPMHFEIKKDEEEEQALTCTNPARPYVILSNKDKKHLEFIIKNKKFEVDPNLEVP